MKISRSYRFYSPSAFFRGRNVFIGGPANGTDLFLRDDRSGNLCIAKLPLDLTYILERIYKKSRFWERRIMSPPQADEANAIVNFSTLCKSDKWKDIRESGMETREYPCSPICTAVKWTVHFILGLVKYVNKQSRSIKYYFISLYFRSWFIRHILNNSAYSHSGDTMKIPD